MFGIWSSKHGVDVVMFTSAEESFVKTKFFPIVWQNVGGGGGGGGGDVLIGYKHVTRETMMQH